MPTKNNRTSLEAAASITWFDALRPLSAGLAHSRLAEVQNSIDNIGLIYVILTSSSSQAARHRLRRCRSPHHEIHDFEIKGMFLIIIDTELNKGVVRQPKGYHGAAGSLGATKWSSSLTT